MILFVKKPLSSRRLDGNPELNFSPLRLEQAASEFLQGILNLSWNSFLPITMNTELQSQSSFES
jgi:hypothetical protein